MPKNPRPDVLFLLGVDKKDVESSEIDCIRQFLEMLGLSFAWESTLPQHFYEYTWSHIVCIECEAPYSVPKNVEVVSIQRPDQPEMIMPGVRKAHLWAQVIDFLHPPLQWSEEQ